MKRSRGNHLSESEMSVLADMLVAREPTAAIAVALNVSERSVQRHRDALYTGKGAPAPMPGCLIEECRKSHARLRKGYQEAIKAGNLQHAGAIKRRMDEWKKRAWTAANYERRAREAA